MLSPQQAQVAMKAYRLERHVGPNGSLYVSDLPFEEGERVEVIVLAQESVSPKHSPVSIRGTVKAFESPTEPVASDEWDACRP